ncbi:MAG: hypothetical protein J5770_07460 [Bacteroidaceae bacterium]|nr:hypothetical protein [Bacteroidaceae bacterium]
MKRLLFILIATLSVVTLQAKKVKVTIDGTTWPSQTKLYLIINEDTANAQLLPIKDGKFSVTLKVDRDAFIRLHDYKEWPERSAFVIIPDSKHITVDMSQGRIEGSKQSQTLQGICQEIKRASPEGFHIDVFSDNPEEWREAMRRGESIRNGMLEQQKIIAKEQLRENKDNIYAAWIVYCFPELIEGELNAILDNNPKWAKHPILHRKK